MWRSQSDLSITLYCPAIVELGVHASAPPTDRISLSNEGYVNHTPEEDLDTDSGRSAHSFRRFKDTVFRHWVIVLIPVIVLPIVALGVGSMSKKNPTVVTNVWVSQDSFDAARIRGAEHFACRQCSSRARRTASDAGF